MPIIGGWAMPEADKYFAKFIPADGPLPKKNGFQREHLMTAFEHVKRWDLALDIGAHVGFWTRDMAERFKTVYAFEAAPDTYECLEKNTGDLPNVIRFRNAVGNVIGKAKLCHDARRELVGNTGSRFVTPGKGEIDMIPIDNLKLDACDFMKIDVEGFEYQVLLGAKETISRHKPTIIMECDKRLERRYDTPLGTAERHLCSKHGYRLAAHLGRDKVFVPE